MQMNETAEAIARMREDAKVDQSDGTARATLDDMGTEKIHAGSSSGRKMSKAVSWGVLTKRQKTSK